MDDLLALAAAPLPTRWAGHPLVVRAETGSTNDDARDAARAGAPHGYAVIADAQSQGRGRRGRSWHSPPGASVYLSLLLRPRLDPAASALLTLAAGLAVADAVARAVPAERVTVKWPNDVRVEARKVAGVLVEGAVRAGALEHVVVGVGVNVRGTELPEELRAIATTLRLASGRDVPRAPFVLDLLRALEDRVDALAAGDANGLLAAFGPRCDTIGARVRVDDVEGRAEAISATGGLLVRTSAGVLCEVRAGEVTLVDADADR